MQLKGSTTTANATLVFHIYQNRFWNAEQSPLQGFPSKVLMTKSFCDVITSTAFEIPWLLKIVKIILVFWYNLPVFYFVLASAPAMIIIHVPHIPKFSITFLDQQLNSTTFQVLHDLYEPCSNLKGQCLCVPASACNPPMKWCSLNRPLPQIPFLAFSHLDFNTNSVCLLRNPRNISLELCNAPVRLKMWIKFYFNFFP